MLALIFAALAALFLGIFVYPYAIYPLILRLLPGKPVRRGPEHLSVSILFSAYNEERSLPLKLQNLRQLKLRYPRLDIFVFDDASSDRTPELLAEAEDVVTLVRGSGRSGKAFGMKQLAKAAQGDILVFTDANVILDESAIDNLLPYYGDPDVGGVCGTLRYHEDSTSTTAQVGAAYWQFDENIRSQESRTGSVMGADGSLFSIRRELYPDFPDSVLDDFTVSMKVVSSGYRLISAQDVIAFENCVAERSEEVSRKIRIGARAYHTHAYLRPELRRLRPMDRFKYTSHKVLRWFGGLNLLLGSFFALTALFLTSTALGLVVFLAIALPLGIALIGTRGPLARGGDAILAILATQVGIFRGMRGQTVTTWVPAKSR